MSTATFDTFKFVERLEKAGVPREHAAAIAEAQRQTLAETLDSSVVTRGDLFEAKAELKADIAALRSDMQALEYRLIIKLGAFFTVAAGILVAVIRLPH